MKIIKFIYSLIGTFFISLAVSSLRLANLGTDPYTTFNLGVSDFLNVGFGVFLMISSLLALIYIYFKNRALIGIGTLFNIFIVGNFSDLTVGFYLGLFDMPSNMILRLTLSLLGIIFLSLGAALYIEAKEGVAPYDALPIILTDQANGKLSYRLSRVIVDVSLVIIGFLFGAVLGINTVITAFFLGPFIQFFRDFVREDLGAKELKYATKK